MIPRDNAQTFSRIVKALARNRIHISDKDRCAQTIKVDSTTQLHQQITISSVTIVLPISHGHKAADHHHSLINIKTTDHNKGTARQVDINSGKLNAVASKDNEA